MSLIWWHVLTCHTKLVRLVKLVTAVATYLVLKRLGEMHG